MPQPTPPPDGMFPAGTHVIFVGQVTGPDMPAQVGHLGLEWVSVEKVSQDWRPRPAGAGPIPSSRQGCILFHDGEREFFGVADNWQPPRNAGP